MSKPDPAYKVASLTGDLLLEAAVEGNFDGDIVFRTGGAERARIKSDGSGTGWPNVLGGSLPYIDACGSTYGAAPSATAAANSTAIQAAIDACAAGVGGVVCLSQPGVYAIATGLQMKNRVVLRGVENEWSIWGYNASPELYQTTTLSADGTAGPVVTFGTAIYDAGLRNVFIKANGRVGVSLTATTNRHGHRLRNVYVNGGSTGIYAGSAETRMENVLVMACTGDGVQIDALDCQLDTLICGFNGGNGVVIGVATSSSANVLRGHTWDVFNNTLDGIQINGSAHRLVNIQANNNNRRGIAFLTCTSTMVNGAYCSNNGREYDGNTHTTRYPDVQFAHPTGGNLGCGLVGGSISSSDSIDVTTTATGVNALNSGTINVGSTVGFATSGTALLVGVGFTYTGLTGTSFTGCGNHAATTGGESIAASSLQSFAVHAAEAVVSFPNLVGVAFAGNYQGGVAASNYVSSINSIQRHGCPGVPDFAVPQGGFAAIATRGSGSADQFRWTDGSGNAWGGVKANGSLYKKFTTLSYSTSVTPDASNGNFQKVTATDGVAFTINAPTSPPAATQTQELTIEVHNSSGGVMGAITWNAAYVFQVGAWVNPAAGKSRIVRFEWNAASWIQTSPVGADF